MLNFWIRYILSILDLNYRESYWDQVRLNELWFKFISESLEKDKEIKKDE